MEIYDILWIDTVVEKIWRKHKVTTADVEEILSGAPKIRFIEKGKIKDEHMYAAFGKTGAGCRLIVFFIKKKNNHALVISARDMTKAERKFYEEK